MNSDKYLLIIMGSGTIIYSIISRLNTSSEQVFSQKFAKAELMNLKPIVPTVAPLNPLNEFKEAMKLKPIQKKVPISVLKQNVSNEGEQVPKEIINEIFEDNLNAGGRGIVYPEPAKKPEYPKNYFKDIAIRENNLERAKKARKMELAARLKQQSEQQQIIAEKHIIISDYPPYFVVI